jgi:asparagine N-glycosylation enzyme membrane subunit Stt3
MNPTTWYLTLAIWFIFVVPLVNLTMKRFGTVQGALVWALLSVLIGWDDTYCHYMIVLLVGIVAARGSLFELLDERVRGLGARSVLALVLAAVAAVLMVLQWRNHQAFGLTEGLVALAVALICHLLLTETPLGLPLVFLGRHATNMFLTHTMLYSFYFLGFFFGFRYWWLVTAVLVVVSLVVSLAIELVEQKSGYDARMAHLGERLFGPAN